MNKKIKKELKLFLVKSNKSGYASNNENHSIKESDGSTSIILQNNSWKYHDNYFGGEPYGGRTVVFYKNRPLWIMLYYGWVKENIESKPVYKFLRNALILPPKENPYRGPEKYRENDYLYQNSWEGNISEFAGKEIISFKKQKIFQTNYLGGLIDQRNCKIDVKNL